MPPRIIKSIVVIRQARAAEFASTNRLLVEGEPAYEIDTGKLKIGDGVTLYNSLPYFNSGDSNNLEFFQALLANHRAEPTPHSAYDDGPSFLLLYENKKV